MTNELIKIKEEFSNRIKRLEEAKVELKKEFLGIDDVIDEIIENVRSWYTMSSMQDKPCVINLWGLTGVGKTSLLLRLLKFIDFEDKTFRFDLGEKEGSMSFRNSLSDLCENKDSSPIAIILDEFQHSRTVKGPFREEIENDKNRMIWELIDSGKVSYIDWKRGLWSFEESVIKLKKLTKAGVVVKNGVVVFGQELYRREMDEKHEKNQTFRFVPELDYDTILDLAGEDLKLELREDVEKLLMTMNGRDTVKFLYKVISLGTRPSVKNFTKSIVFVVGNIDEAYKMSGNYTADISADEFYELSLKITIPEIKKALRARFRDEQIARLGNIHIIYPALSSSAYKGIIQMELNTLSVQFRKMFKIEVEFENSLINEILKEGLYPTQGARPLFTTIHQMVKSKLSVHMSVILMRKLTVDKMILSVSEGQLACNYYQRKKLVFTYSDTITSNLEKLRKPKKDERQAITAVHEAGHAVLLIALTKNIPELVLSVTSDTEASGFLFSKDEREFTSKNDILLKTAILLGGLVAEEIIFGENYVTAGASTDILKATSAISSLYKEHGFGKVPIAYAKNTEASEEYKYHQTSQIEEEIKSIILKSKVLANETLKREMKLLLAIASQLSNVAAIGKEKLVELIKVNSNITELDGGMDNYYRNRLQQFISTYGIVTESILLPLNSITV